MLRGGCFCGHVRYEGEGTPFHPTLCHCADCRRIAGAPVVAWFSLPSGGFHFTAGQPSCFASSEKARRCFCPRCGTPLTFQDTGLPDEIDITTASLDDPELVPPGDHTRTRSRLSWMHLPDGLPRYSVARDTPPE
jgi:hypothetical protein